MGVGPGRFVGPSYRGFPRRVGSRGPFADPLLGKTAPPRTSSPGVGQCLERQRARAYSGIGDAMAISSENFRNALSHFAAGVTITTIRAGEHIHGLTVSAFASVSADP